MTFQRIFCRIIDFKCIIPKKIRLFAGLVMWCLFLGAGQSLQAERVGTTDTLPSEMIGNWSNSISRNWEYGFFEKFAIYETDFWEYKQIKQTRKQTFIRLEKEGKQVDLRIRRTKDGVIQMACGEGKFQPYQRKRKGFLPYPEKDTTDFTTSGFAADTVTLLGYYRNMGSLTDGQRRKVAEVSTRNLLNEGTYLADIDSFGRFQIKIPVNAMEGLIVDWGFLNKRIYAEPGEKILFYADAIDLVTHNGNSREEYWTRERDVLFMGKNARLHNEIAFCPIALNFRDYDEVKKQNATDMEFLKLVEADYLDYMKGFESYKLKYPTLSRKCVSVVEANTIYEFVFHLMQNRFSIRKKGRLAFDTPAYMDYVSRICPWDREWGYLLDSYFASFMRDYIGYQEDQRATFYPEFGVSFTPSLVQGQDVLEKMIEEGSMTGDDIPLVVTYWQLQNKMDTLWESDDTLAIRKISEDNRQLFDKMDGYLKSKEGQGLKEWMTAERVLLSYDTLIAPGKLWELIAARYYMQVLENKRTPFTPRTMALLDKRVLTPGIKERVKEINEQYRRIADKEITYLESLKSAEGLKEFTDAKALFSELIAPYKGCVIYLDIWGTWCNPCREQMKHVAPVKEALKGKEVVFLYLANRSEEKTWKSLIKEYELTGENVVHYRLPEEQQQMLERLLGVSSFPTFMLLDKQGEIVNPHAPRPMEKEQLLREIQVLLDKR